MFFIELYYKFFKFIIKFNKNMYYNKAHKKYNKNHTQQYSTKNMKKRSKSKIIPELVKFTAHKIIKNVT